MTGIFVQYPTMVYKMIFLKQVLCSFLREDEIYPMRKNIEFMC
ncbi:hypothetical protein M118_4538 [Bacteroides fragilis str. 3783N1-2]|nr:hypothetical protein M118_4538 [Bacteroides fragilis str. 3783N1-2]EXZ71022.1 hypothetical protein M120_4853 [Bacteroides fragilis str. 3783N1-8]